MADILARLTTALADRYRIERELGQGGMATVYLAQDLKHDRQVAIKVLRPELAAVIGAERFLSEIKTTANLQHPHILPLHDSGDADRLPLLRHAVRRGRVAARPARPARSSSRSPTRCASRSEVAGALDYAHRHSVIHRDIKPENILLHDGRALVADFGIALAASKAGGSRMTETGMSLGTPPYMSPEQAMGEREITARSDIYALGCVTYEMLVGEPPFTGPTAQAIVAKVMTAEPARSHAAAQDVPAARRGRGAHRPGEAAGRPVRRVRRSLRERLDGKAVGRFGGMAARHGVATAVPPYRRTAPILAAFVVLAALALWGWLRHAPTTAQPVRRNAVALSGDEGIVQNSPGTLAIAPGGERVAYVGRSMAGVERSGSATGISCTRARSQAPPRPPASPSPQTGARLRSSPAAPGS